MSWRLDVALFACAFGWCASGETASYRGGALWLCLHSLFWSEGLWGVSAAGVGSWLLVRDAGSRVYVQVEGGYLLYGLGLAAEVWAFCLSIVTVGCGL